MMYYALCIYIIVESVQMVLYIFDKLDFYEISIQLSIIIIIFSSCIIVFWIVINIMFSGSPYINNDYKRKIETLSRVIGIMTILKLIRGSVGVVQQWGLIETVINEFESKNDDNELMKILFLAMFLVCDIVPVLVVLDSTVLHTFTIQARKPEDYSMLECQLLPEESPEDEEMNIRDRRKNQFATSEQTIDASLKNSKSPMVIALSLGNIQENDYSKPSVPSMGNDYIKSTFTELGKVEYEDNKSASSDYSKLGNISSTLHFESTTANEKYRLGKLYECVFTDESPIKATNMVCRVIKFDRLTSYIIDEYCKDMVLIYSLPTNSIVKIQYVFIDQSKIYVFMEKEVSLYQCLHIDKINLSNEDKYNICLQLCRILKALHELERKTFHQHLSSRNLFLQPCKNIDEIESNQYEDRYMIKIGDIGDLELRNTAKIFAKYEIRNAWSCPELLSNPELAFSDSETTQNLYDVYSFGMIMWEIYCSKIPFGDSIEFAKQYVVDKKQRPKIESFIPQNIQNIIKKCWCDNPLDRFQSMGEIEKALI